MLEVVEKPKTFDRIDVNTDWEVWTDSGWQDFDAILEVQSDNQLAIVFNNGTELTCTEDHKLFQTADMFVMAKELKIGDVVFSDRGPITITDIAQKRDTVPVYDLLDVKNGNKWFASGILSRQCIYLDEFAHIPSKLADEFYTSVLPTISSGETTKIIISSTPKGMNLFFKLWNDSEHKRNDYKNLSIHYSETPGRDEAWAEAMIRSIGQIRFEQEFGCSFLGSSFTLINAAKIEALEYEDPKFTDGILSIFEEPQDKHNYVICIDTSDGVQRDFSTFVITDVSHLPYRVVATYRDNTIEPLLFPDIIYKIATHYNKANIICENNNMGQQVANVLYFDYEYEHIFSTIKEFATNEIDEGNGRLKPGIRTTKTTKRIGCSNLKTLIENDQLYVVDFQIIEEFSRFVKTKTSYAADEGAHDDLVMCLVIFGWLTTQPYFQHLTDTNLRQVLSTRRAEQVEEALVPFGILYEDTSDQEMIVDLWHVDFDKYMNS
jgi:hypothetical protein